LLYFTVVFLFLGLAMVTRLSYGKRPAPKRKPGETESEAEVILLGTFRVYSWLVWLTLSAFMVGLLTDWMMPAWYWLLFLVLTVVLLILAHALYWRLGYDHRRWIFVWAHLSGVFVLTEYLYALRADVQAYAGESEAK
jgi:hypothetical protein